MPEGLVPQNIKSFIQKNEMQLSQGDPIPNDRKRLKKLLKTVNTGDDKRVQCYEYIVSARDRIG